MIVREEPKATAVAEDWRVTSPDHSRAEGRGRDGSVLEAATERTANVMGILPRDLYTSGGMIEVELVMDIRNTKQMKKVR